MAEHPKPSPAPTDSTLPFFAGAAADKLRLRHCARCGSFTSPTRIVCACGHTDLSWADTSGHGQVFSFTIVHRAPDPAFRAEVPYVIAIVELAEGPKLMSNIVGCRPDDVRVGMPVEAVFDKMGADIAIPKFKPIA